LRVTPDGEVWLELRHRWADGTRTWPVLDGWAYVTTEGQAGRQTSLREFLGEFYREGLEEISEPLGLLVVLLWLLGVPLAILGICVVAWKLWRWVVDPLKDAAA